MSDLLLVDNDRRIVELVAFFLGKRGHAVRTAASFAAARAALAERAPELMLADLDLGVERGDEELPLLARERLLPPTLIVSGYLDAPTEERLLSIPGIMGTLRKPFDLSTLEARIADAIASAKRASIPAPDEETGWIDVAPRREGGRA